MFFKRHNAVNYCIYSIFLIFIFANLYFVENINPQKLHQVQVQLSDINSNDVESKNEIVKKKYIEIDTLINFKKTNQVNYKKNTLKKDQKKSNTIKKNYF